MPRDPAMLRNLLEIVGVLHRGVEVFGRDGVLASLDFDAPPRTFPGPDRSEIEAVLAG